MTVLPEFYNVIHVRQKQKSGKTLIIYDPLYCANTFMLLQTKFCIFYFYDKVLVVVYLNIEIYAENTDKESVKEKLRALTGPLYAQTHVHMSCVHFCTSSRSVAEAINAALVC